MLRLKIHYSSEYMRNNFFTNKTDKHQEVILCKRILQIVFTQISLMVIASIKKQEIEVLFYRRCWSYCFGNNYYGDTDGNKFKKYFKGGENTMFNGIKVSLNMKDLNLQNEAGITVEPFTYHDAVYLPLEAVAKAIGFNVK